MHNPAPFNEIMRGQTRSFLSGPGSADGLWIRLGLGLIDSAWRLEDAREEGKAFAGKPMRQRRLCARCMQPGGRGGVVEQP